MMRVRDLLGLKPTSLVAVEPKAELEVAVRLLIDHNIGGLPVVEPEDRLVGFVAERDIALAVHEHRGIVHHLRVEDVMRPASICEVEDSVDDVMRWMTNRRLRHLVVQHDGRTVGVISVGDIVKQRLSQLETEAGVLRDYVIAQRASRY